MNLEMDLAPDQGVVYKKTSGFYTVRTPAGMLACTLSARLLKGLEAPGPKRKPARRPEPEKGDEWITVGDRVRWTDGPTGTGQIVELLPRRSKLARRAAAPMPGAHAFEQVIVANVDQVVPVFAAANPVPKWNMLDRYLVSAEAAGLPAVVCITKVDLAGEPGGRLDEDLERAVEMYRAAGYPVVLTSAQADSGLDQLRQALQGRISVFLGKSGVGKTSLLNALQPGLGLRVNAVSQVTGKGKHTTTHLEMFPLEYEGAGGGAIVDTPGVREFGLVDLDGADLALFFPEMRPFIGQCRFGLDCRHDEEPGCAIRKAVLAGEIDPHRYQSYLRLSSDP